MTQNIRKYQEQINSKIRKQICQVKRDGDRLEFTQRDQKFLSYLNSGIVDGSSSIG